MADHWVLVTFGLVVLLMISSPYGLDRLVVGSSSRGGLCLAGSGLFTMVLILLVLVMW